MKNSGKILLAEDDANLGMILKEFLQVRDFEVHLAGDGKKALELYKSRTYDLCLLDIMMPKTDGFTVAKEIRKTDDSTPVIFLTAKSMQQDKIEGLKIGADDYITKPFSAEELFLRINAVLKRTGNINIKNNNINNFIIGKYKFEYEKRLLVFNGVELKLTTKEAELLRLLCESKNRLLTRKKALLKIWESDNYFAARSMDVYISKLRTYLKRDKNIEIINVHGSGYKLIEK